LALSTNS